MSYSKKTWYNKGETGATQENSVINKTNMNDLEDRIHDAIYHKLGESFTVGGFFLGRLRDSQKLIEFTVTTPKLLDKIPSADNINISGQVVITHSDGQYIASNVDITSLGDVTQSYKRNNQISFVIRLTNPPTNLRNNALVMIALVNCIVSIDKKES